MALVRKNPASLVTLEDNGQMVAILEQKWREHLIPVHTFRGETKAFANFLFEIPLDCLNRHG
jgi:hypothetical protein